MKTSFYKSCLDYVQQRLKQANADMIAAQESSNSETKSSAGDKYETGRAMAQQERDHHAKQLHEAQQLLEALRRINPDLACDTVRLGATVQTSLGLFYVSIGAGRLRTTEGTEFIAVSLAAPIMRALDGRHAGEEVNFNGKAVRVLAVS